MTIILLKLLASSGILFAYYWLFLRNRKFHRYNRFYLLGAVLVSMVLPFLKIEIFLSPEAPANKMLLDTLDVITVSGGEQEVVMPDQGLSWMDWFNSTNIMWIVYILGAVVFLSILIRSIIYIRKIKRNYPVEKIEDLKFYNTAEPGTPFSFFRNIFWNSKVEFNSSEGQQIFRHELFHVRQKHSADLLFMEIVMLFAWFNPFFYLIKKELKAIHEFLADEYAASNSDEYAYAELLVLFALHEKQNKLVHPFFHNTIKRRIAMITNLKNKRVNYWGRIMALPLSLLLFSFIVLKAQKTEITEDKTNEHLNTDVAIQPITVVIDAAHGGTASGALSNDRKVYEKDINLAIANKIAALAPSYNVNIVLTRNDDNTITAQDRVAYMNSVAYDLLVSIHVNASAISREPKPDYPNKSGFEVYVSRNNTASSNKSEILAKHLITKLEPLYTTYNKTKIREYESIYILDKGQKPAVLVECGYINNNKDLAYITDPSNQENIAKKILEGIVTYNNSIEKDKTLNTNNENHHSTKDYTTNDTLKLSPEAFDAKLNKSDAKKPKAKMELKDGQCYLKIENDPHVYTVPMNDFNTYEKNKKGGKENKNEYRDLIFTKTEVESQFEGGIDAWGKYLRENIVYPKEAITKNIQGTIIVQFIVDKEGKLSDLKTLGGNPLLCEEALRVVKNSSGKWLPALQNNHIVKAYKKQPIIFQLDKQASIESLRGVYNVVNFEPEK